MHKRDAFSWYELLFSKYGGRWGRRSRKYLPYIASNSDHRLHMSFFGLQRHLLATSGNKNRPHLLHHIKQGFDHAFVDAKSFWKIIRKHELSVAKTPRLFENATKTQFFLRNTNTFYAKKFRSCTTQCFL